MRSRTVALGLAFLLLLTRSSVSLGQSAPGPREWSAVKAVPPGDELVVKLKTGKAVKGRLRVISDIHLTLARGKKTVDLDRQDVQQIHASSRNQRLSPRSSGLVPERQSGQRE